MGSILDFANILNDTGQALARLLHTVKNKISPSILRIPATIGFPDKPVMAVPVKTALLCRRHGAIGAVPARPQIKARSHPELIWTVL